MAVRPGVTVVKDDVARFLSGIEKLATTQAFVGVPSSTAPREEDDATINNAALAYIHENGAPEANIPARPFLFVTVRAQKDEIAKRLKTIGQAALEFGNNSPERIDKGFHALGLFAQNAVRAKINTGPFQPLAPATIAARLRRGRTGTRPLIDTGQLRNSIAYVIREVKRART